MRFIPSVDNQPSMTAARHTSGVLLGLLALAVLAFCMIQALPAAQDARAMYLRQLVSNVNTTIAAPSAEMQLRWSELPEDEAPDIEVHGGQKLFHFNKHFERIITFNLPK
jgi:hypothetical protein